MRPEQLGELVAGVLDELAERLQPGQDDQVSGKELLPQVVGGPLPVSMPDADFPAPGMRAGLR